MIKTKNYWKRTKWLILCFLTVSFLIEGAEKIKEEKYPITELTLSSKTKQLVSYSRKKTSKKHENLTDQKRIPFPPSIGPSGPPGPIGPQGPQGPQGEPGMSVEFTQDKEGELNFEIALFQVGPPKFTLLHATPYVIRPNGTAVIGHSVTINLLNTPPDSFIDLFSSTYGGAPIKISSPEYGVYQIGVQVFTQTFDQKEFNLNLAANIVAIRGETLLPTTTEVIPSSSQTLLRQQSTQIQLHATYFYGVNQHSIP